jgi:steroid 5-alpha reductase family enzyme
MALLGPLVLTVLLRCVWGVPVLESDWATDPQWRRYASVTPPFLPRLRVRSAADAPAADTD